MIRMIYDNKVTTHKYETKTRKRDEKEEKWEAKN